MKMRIAFLIILFGTFQNNEFSQELLPAFASNLDNSDGIEHSDVSNSDLYRVSARLTPESTLSNGTVYVALVMHNEDPNSPNYPNYSSFNNQNAYLNARDIVVSFCEMLHGYGVPFNWESDWNFLLGTIKWDTPEVMASTNGKNIVRYLKEDLGISIDPHSHENNDYNYADVAHLIDSLGVTPTSVIGGHVWDPDDPGYQNWERFRQPLQGNQFPWSSWHGNILIGSGTGLHTNDPNPSGVWRPKDKYHYWEDDPNGNVYAIGQYQFGTTVQNIQGLVDLYKSGTVSPDKILTANIVIGQHTLTASSIADFENNTLKPLLEMQARGEIKLVTFSQLIDEWQNIYNAVPNLYGINNTTAVSAPSFQAVKIYPNPATNFLIVQNAKPIQEAKILSSEGRRYSVAVNDNWLDVSTLPAGFYLVQIQFSDGSFAVQKFIITR